jgi:hypothetical protein
MVTARSLHCCKCDSSGQLIGEANPSPILDTRIYNAEFPYGHMGEYASTNVVAENLYS